MKKNTNNGIKAYNGGKRNDFFWGKTVLWMSMLILIALVLSYFRLIHFAEGGDITWFSMFFIFLLGYFFGAKGIVAALIFSVLKYFCDIFATKVLFENMNNLFINLEQPFAEAMDYLFSYTIVAAGGLFARPFGKENREKYEKRYNVGTTRELRYLITGYIIGMIFRFISSVANFVIFYSRGDFFADLHEGIVYCVGYVGIETALTVLFLLIPWVNKPAEYCKYVATHPYPFDVENI